MPDTDNKKPRFTSTFALTFAETAVVLIIVGIVTAVGIAAFSASPGPASRKGTPVVNPPPPVTTHASSSVPVAMILLIAGLIAAAVVIVAAVAFTTVSIRGRRRTAAAAAAALAQAAAGRRRSWDAALSRLATVDRAYAAAMLDPDYFLRFPLINDLTNPSVRALEDAHEIVLSHHTETYVDDAQWIATFSAAVDGFSAAWAVADTAVRSAGLSPIPRKFRGNVPTAVKLMTHALDPAASDEERAAFRDKALSLLGNSVTPRRGTLDAITAPVKRELVAA